jgi:hypothetical protein
MRLAMTVAVLVFCCGEALGKGRPYVTVRDDGRYVAFRTANGGADVLSATVMDLYGTSGAPRPNVLSVWSSFNFDGNFLETIALNQTNAIQGLNFQSVFGGDGTFASPFGNVEIILLHNNLMRMTERAAAFRAPVDQYANYLFLLELSHRWGPAISVPGSALIGFTFHWSFWLDAGGSMAGGNRWKDNGDGTFSTQLQSPTDIHYSMLELYLMGLADPTEVPPFGILENVVPPSTPTDPYSHQKYAATSFPDFDATPLTVKATRRELTIVDVINANGTRAPARAAAPNKWSLGLMLLVPKDATDAEIEAAQAAFDPIAATLAPSFSAATMGRGSLQIITGDAGMDVEPVDAGVGDSGGDAGMAQLDAGVDVVLEPLPLPKKGCSATGIFGLGSMGAWIWVGRRKR